MKHTHSLDQDCTRACPSFDYAKERRDQAARKQDVAANAPVDLNTNDEFMDTGVLYSDED